MVVRSGGVSESWENRGWEGRGMLSVRGNYSNYWVSSQQEASKEAVEAGVFGEQRLHHCLVFYREKRQNRLEPLTASLRTAGKGWGSSHSTFPLLVANITFL